MKQILLSSQLGLLLTAIIHAASPVPCEDGRLNNGIVSVSCKEHNPNPCVPHLVFS